MPTEPSAESAVPPTEKTAVVEESPPAAAATVAPASAELEKVKLPSVITTSEEYDKVYRYLASRYHVLTPVTAFSGMAPQHGLVVAKVLIDSDPAHGEVYQDKLFCKIGEKQTGSKDPLDDEVAIAKVGLRKLAIAGGWNLTAQVLRAERHYWMVQAFNAFVGLDGAVQRFSATEEYDLRDGSPQVRAWTQAQKESARAHGLRGAEARAFNAACREFGIRHKYTKRELQKAFVVMRMMFIPDASNEVQMRIVTERALAGTQAMYPQQLPAQAIVLDPIEGMHGVPLHVGETTIDAQTPQKKASDLGLTGDQVLIFKIEPREIPLKAPKTGSFTKWIVTDSNGDEHTTTKKDFSKTLYACWNKDDWKKGRPLEITSAMNSYKENEISELLPAAAVKEPA